MKILEGPKSTNGESMFSYTHFIIHYSSLLTFMVLAKN